MACWLVNNMRIFSLKNPNQLRDGFKIKKTSAILTNDTALSHILGTGEQLRSTAEAIINKTSLVFLQASIFLKLTLVTK